MREVVAIAVVVTLALLGLVPGLRRLRAALGYEHFISSGHLFLVIGVVLGPAGLGLLDAALLADLRPVLVFLLAWMGLIVGLRLEFALLGRVGGGPILLTGVEAALPALLVPFALVLLPGMHEAPATLVVAGGCAAGTAATAATYLARGRRSSELSFVIIAASLDDWVVVLLTLVGFALHRGITAQALGMGAAGLLAAAGVGIAISLLAPRLEQSGEELVVTIGGAALAGGLAVYLGLSTVVAGALAGLVVANIGRKQRGTQDLYELVTRVERPLFHAFVILAGALLTFQAPMTWIPIAVVFILARGLGRLAGGWAGARAGGGQVQPMRVTATLLPMSPLALAVAVDLWLVHPAPFTQALLLAVAAGWVIFEGIATVVAPRVLGEPL